MAVTNHYKATVTLGAVTLGYLASYPFKASFAGGLLSSGCVAAMIGGLADWFAITALFRNPLGIRWPRWLRTEIIPRNRDRLVHEIVNMVENELLTVDKIQKKFEAYDISALLLRFLQVHKGKQDLQQILHNIIQDILDQLDSAETGKLLEGVLKEHLQKVKISPLMAQIVNYTFAAGYDVRVLHFVIDELIKLLQHHRILDVLTPLIGDVISAYEKGMRRRKLAHWIVGNAGNMSNASLAQEAQTKTIEFLHSLKSPGHPLRLKLKSWIIQFADSLESQPAMQAKVEVWKNEMLQHLNVQTHIVQWVAKLRRTFPANSQSISDHGMAWIGVQMDRIIANFANNKDQQGKLNQLIKQAVMPWIGHAHQHISTTVRVSLNHLTNDKLVDFIQSKAGNDLQMIRINGSVVGGFVGMLIFIITFYLKMGY